MESLETLKAFLSAWILQDWQIMWEQCQLSWSHRHTLEDLKKNFGVIPGKYEIVATTANSSVRQEAEFTLSFPDGSVTAHRAVLVCESEAYNPVPFGSWGVNPVSVLQVLETLKEKDNAGQKKGKS